MFESQIICMREIHDTNYKFVTHGKRTEIPENLQHVILNYFDGAAQFKIYREKVCFRCEGTNWK
jgi:hypothetical protein